jgi:hypothetical protein
MLTRRLNSEESHHPGAPVVHGADGLLLYLHPAENEFTHEHAEIRSDQYGRTDPRFVREGAVLTGGL